MIEILPIKSVHPPPTGSKGSYVVVERAGGEPPSFRDAVLYPKNTEVEVRDAHKSGSSASGLTLRGAPRAALRPGSLLLSAGTEFFVTSWALLRGDCRTGSWTVSRIPCAPHRNASVGEIRCDLRLLEGGAAGFVELRAEVPLPLIPGRRYTLSADGRECEVVVALAGPKPPTASAELITKLLSKHDSADLRAIERTLLELYGITPRVAARAGDPGAGRAAGLDAVAEGRDVYAGRSSGPAERGAVGAGLHGFTNWVVTEQYMEEIEELVREAMAVEGGIRVKELRTLVTEASSFVPGTLWRELVGEIQRRLDLIRREGVLLAGGEISESTHVDQTGRRPPDDKQADDDQALSPGEKAVWSTILEAGVRGTHVKSSGPAGSKPLVSSLVDRGLVVKLPNGRLFARSVYRELAVVEEEVDDRKAAALWGVSRSTARELIEQMVRDGLMRKTSPRSAVSRAGGEDEPS